MNTRRGFIFGLLASPFVAPVLATTVKPENLVLTELDFLIAKTRIRMENQAVADMVRMNETLDQYVKTGQVRVTYTETFGVDEFHRNNKLMEEWANFAVFSEPKINLVKRMS